MISFNAKSQGLTRNNVVLEIGGASIFYSINYERLLLKNTDSNIAVRIGGMFFVLKNDNQRYQGVPIGISYLKKVKKNFFEVGFSASAIYITTHKTSIYSTEDQYLLITPSIRLGIRHQPNTKGLYLNGLIQFSLLADYDLRVYQYTQEVDYTFFPFASFGIGYSF